MSFYHISPPSSGKFAENYQEKRKEARNNIDYWANNQEWNYWFRGKDLKEYYSPTSCYREVHHREDDGTYTIHNFHYYLRNDTGGGVDTDSHDDIKWPHEELTAIERNYCAYNFWGIWDFPNSGQPSFATMAGQLPGGGWWYRERGIEFIAPNFKWNYMIHEGIRHLHGWTWAYNYINTHILDGQTIDIFTSI